MIDNAPYHSKDMENYPTSKWRKQQFVDWVTEKNITFPDKVIETVAKEYGHEMLLLSPYHCELNPVELPWDEEKTM